MKKLKTYATLLFLFLSLLSSAKTLEEQALPYFEASEYQSMQLSPNGKYIATETYYDADEHIEIIDIAKMKTYVIFTGTNGIKTSIQDYKWVDENTIIIQLDNTSVSAIESLFKIIHLKLSDDVSVESSFEFLKYGTIIYSMPNVENKLLLAINYNSKKYSSGAFYADVTSLESLKTSVQMSHKIGGAVDRAFYWLPDKNNTVRMILSKSEKQINFWLKNKHTWKKVYTIDSGSDNLFIPSAIDNNGNIVVIKHSANKDKKGLYLLDANSFKTIKEIYYNDDFDVESVKIDNRTHKINTVNFVKDGIFKHYFVDEKLKNISSLVQKKFPKHHPMFTNANIDGNIFLFFIHNFEDDGSFVLVNSITKKVKRIARISPHKRKLKKAHLKVLKLKSDDDYTIEAYLSLPKDKVIKALIVEPHGGPIGVRSYAFFDSFSHYLSSFGIAVLKINYRGSSGFGKKFQKAGNQQWGNKIEKDINDVVSYVVEKFHIDKTKICAEGASYGGYSALMLHINYPTRYKCVISMAGPTDLPLMFTSSDWNRSNESIKSMIEIVGDPMHDLDRLKKQSPVYNARKIHAPVLLVHGTEDPRVNVEHSVRLEYVLKKLKKPVLLKLVAGEKHGFQLLKNEIYYANEVVKFVNKSLDLNLNLSNDDSKSQRPDVESPL